MLIKNINNKKLPEFNKNELLKYFPKGLYRIEIVTYQNQTNDRDNINNIKFRIYNNDTSIGFFVLDENSYGLLKYKCINKSYNKIFKSIFRKYIHHESTDKMLNIWSKNNEKYTYRTESNFTKKSKKTTTKKSPNINSDFVYVLVQDTKIIIENSKYDGIYDTSSLPSYITSFLNDYKNNFITFNTNELYVWSRENKIPLYCFYDVRIILAFCGIRTPKGKIYQTLSQLAKDEQIKLTSITSKMEYFKSITNRTFHYLKRIENKHVLYKTILPYNVILNKMIFNTIKMNIPLYDKIIDEPSFDKNSKLLKRIPRENFYTNNFNVSTTFRFSAANMNLQTIPAKKLEIRKLLKTLTPRKKCSFLSIDLKNADIMCLAQLSGDLSLLSILKSSKDIYIIIANIIFNSKSINIEKRDFAKNFLLQWCYGGAAKSAAKKLYDFYIYNESSIITMEECIQLVENIYKKLEVMFHTLNEYKEKIVIDKHYKNEHLINIARVRMIFPQKLSRFHAKRKITSNLVQSSTSFVMMDFTNQIINRCNKQLLGVLPIYQIHDELILDVPDKFIGIVKDIIKEISVINAFLDFDIKHKIVIGKNLSEII